MEKLLQQFAFKPTTNKNIKTFAGLSPAKVFYGAFDR